MQEFPKALLRIVCHAKEDGIQAREPIGRCIYCGQIEDLSREHVVAFSLGWKGTLLKASCRGECQKQTGYIEGYVTKRLLGALRVGWGLSSRRKTIELDPIPVRFTSPSGERIVEVPGEEIRVAFFPLYRDLPGILTDAPLDAPLVSHGTHVSHDTQYVHDTMRRYARPDETEWRIENLEIKSDAFARMIAKIAHVAAVNELGIDSFVHRLPGIILGTDKKLGYYIGAGKPPGKPIAAPGTTVAVSQLHSIDLLLLRRSGRTPLIMAEIGLFPFAGTPTYRAVVGEAGPTAERILERASQQST